MKNICPLNKIQEIVKRCDILTAQGTHIHIHMWCALNGSVKIKFLVCNACHVWVASDNIKSHSSKLQGQVGSSVLTGLETHYVRVFYS